MQKIKIKRHSYGLIKTIQMNKIVLSEHYILRDMFHRRLCMQRNFDREGEVEVIFFSSAPI